MTAKNPNAPFHLKVYIILSSSVRSLNNHGSADIIYSSQSSLDCPCPSPPRNLMLSNACCACRVSHGQWPSMGLSIDHYELHSILNETDPSYCGLACVKSSLFSTISLSAPSHTLLHLPQPPPLTLTLIFISSPTTASIPHCTPRIWNHIPSRGTPRHIICFVGS